MKRIFILNVLGILLFAACKKDNVPVYNPSVNSSLSVEFDNIAGSSDLQLNTGSYHNAAGETFSVTKLRYYVSNFVLTSASGSVFTVPQDSCYFLIDESDSSTHEPVLHIPEGEYKTIRFTVGIDSARSVAPLADRTGVLDPQTGANGMYQGVDDGYVFFRMEGTTAALPAPGIFQYLIGGYGAKSRSNIKTVTLDLSARGMPKVKTGLEPNIHLMVDILKVFDGTTIVSLQANPVTIFDDFNQVIADNYVAMFRHDHTEN